MCACWYIEIIESIFSRTPLPPFIKYVRCTQYTTKNAYVLRKNTYACGGKTNGYKCKKK